MSTTKDMSLMSTIKALSIKHKLILIMMATSLTTIILMAPLVIINQAINSQYATQQQLITLADVLGSRSTGALTFDDPTTGTEILNALTLKSDIVYAVIERANGDSFAIFGDLVGPTKALDFNSPHTTDRSVPFWADLLSNKIHVARDIYLENERIGKIRIVSTLDKLRDDLLNYILLVAAISFISFVIAFLVCSRLQRIVSNPIVDLHKTMDTVTRLNDYSLRVENKEENELGDLVNGFNIMLEQIQDRDNKLAKYSVYLEETIAARTLQLTEANKRRILWLETMARFLRHELKNSSVGIKTSLDLIERRTTEKENISIYLTRARRSMDNMNALLQSAGDASDLEASLYKEEKKPLDLSLTVREHMETYAFIYPDSMINSECQPGILILGNELRLNQLLDKLISNAVEHSTNHEPIEVIVKQQHGKAQLLVSNRGDALPKNKMVIFDQFITLRTPERKTDENYGLGLYIVKLIAESHGGHVEARDLNGATGAVFEVTIPLITQDRTEKMSKGVILKKARELFLK